MECHKNVDNVTDWYELWMQQSQNFFAAADEHLKSVFSENLLKNPEANLKQIQRWLATLQSRWQQTQPIELDTKAKAYWDIIANMYHKAGELMLAAWLKRAKTNLPVTNLHDLYQLWLSACQQSYLQLLQMKQYQDMASGFLQHVNKFWQQRAQQ